MLLILYLTGTISFVHLIEEERHNAFDKSAALRTLGTG